jgi:hypothetical protein
MLIKIYGGTRSGSGASLCETCRASRIVRGQTLDEEIVFCDATPMQSIRVGFKVTSCSDYADARQPTYLELLEKAWILTPASKRRPAGFVRASELQEEERARLMVEQYRDSR